MCNSKTIIVTLPILRETGHYIVADDGSGTERWIDTRTAQSLTIAESGEEVTVELDRKKWERRIAQNSIKAPTSEQKKVRRKCLNCRNEFDADPVMRICTPCKSTAAWSYGGDYALMS